MDPFDSGHQAVPPPFVNAYLLISTTALVGRAIVHTILVWISLDNFSSYIGRKWISLLSTLI
jgi:hypothetical protein